MDIGTIILFGGVLVFAAHFFAWLFSFTRIPDVLLLLLVGILVGPILGGITPDFFGQTGVLFSLIVLTIILFEGGTEMRIDVIRGAIKGTAALTTFSFLVSMLVVGVGMWWFLHVPLLLALAFGATIGGTSSAVVIPLLEQLQIGSEAKAALTIESALTDVLSVVSASALFLAYTAGGVSPGTVALDIVFSFLGASVVGVVAGMVWSLLLTRIRTINNSIFTTPAFVLILFGVSELLGLSGPIAALAFGVTLGNSAFARIWLERRHIILSQVLHPVAPSERERSFFSEIVFVFQTFFFVYVGISIPVYGSAFAWTLALVVVAAIFLFRIFVVRFTAESDVPSRDRAFMASIVPKGLAAAVLATLIFDATIPFGELLQQVTFLVILVSVVATSVLLFCMSRTPLVSLYMKLTGGEGDSPHAGTS